MRDITVQFPGVKALDGVDLRLLPGEVHALMGENGAGKSTLIKALTGVNAIDGGEIVIDGETRRLTGTADAQRAGVAVVYQEVNLCTNLSIGENVMLGHEVRKRVGIDWTATHRAAIEHLDKLGLGHLDPRRPLSTVSLAVQQLVAISRAMVGDSRVLVLDEPTSSLDSHEVEQLFTVMRRLRADGVALLFVSHFLDQVYEISDRITVLRDGRHQGEYLTDELDRSSLISKMIGKDLRTLRSLDADRDDHRAERHDDRVLHAVDIGRSGAVAPTDIDLHRGEVVGIAGLLGSGRTELARLLCGADRADTGSIEIEGEPVRMASPATGLAHNVAYSSENRRDEGSIGDLTVRENIILALQAQRGWMRPMSAEEQDTLVTEYIAALGVRPPNPDIPMKNLSGGNQQKVLLARWLATQPRILILDEPTRGIDVGAKAEIQAAIAKLSEEGVSVVFISSELDEVVRLSDRVVVLRDRSKIDEILVGPGTTTATVVEMIAGEATP
ncbi:sugar ABC transporter ATP-binding protein [Euzebya sp.]|uniref:sugar ABC transporter ATP-binding protein n=1 Tax=Euzebya sp. TaxID=1971409 RepID=UPI0035188153